MDSVNLKLPDVNRVGVITPPDELHRPVLYSDREASAQFRQLDNDIYVSSKKAKPKKKFGLFVLK
jgi:hypothetical protein